MSSAEPVAHAHKTLVTLNERETVTILPTLKKLNSSLRQSFCFATFSEDSSKLYLSYTSNQEYTFAIDTLKTSLLILEESPIEPGQEFSEGPVLKIAEIELDQQNLEFVTNNMEQINNALAKTFCRYTCVSHSTKGNPQLQATDSETLTSAFEFIRSGLMNVHNRANVRSPNSDSAPITPPSPTRSDPNCSIEVKKWIIPAALYELCTDSIDGIFRDNDCEYSYECTTSGNVILEYVCTSLSLSKIKPELESIVKKFQSLTQQTAPPSYQTSDTKLDSPSRTSGHFSYQEGTNGPPHPVSTGIEVSRKIVFTDFVVPKTNPFYEDMNPSAGDAQYIYDTTSSQAASMKALQSIPNTQVDLNPKPDSVHKSQQPTVIPQSQQPTVIPQSMNTTVIPDSPDYPPNNTNKFRDNYDQHSHESNSLTKKGNTSKSRENTLSAALRQKPTPPHPPHPESTCRVDGTHPVDTSQYGRSSIPTHQDTYSHQSLEPIIQYGNKYVCVVSLSKDTWYTEAKYIEQTLLGLRIIPCPTQPRVCTLTADQREMIKCGLKELNKKFGRLGYLPPCNGIPIMTAALKSIVELDGKPKQSQNVETLASLTCSSGLSIDIKSMFFTEGRWDAVVKSVEQDAIHTLRQNGIDILDVVGPDTRPEEGRRLAKSAYKLEYWYFYVAESRNSVSNRIVYLVIPSWNPDNFKPNSLKESIISILSYCNSHSIESIAFPIIGYQSKGIPIPLSAQALLQGIDEFSSHTQSPCLKRVDIVITNKACIRSFQYHFVTPIQRHLKAPSEDKKVIVSESTEEEEDTCPICLEGLYSSGPAVLKLSQCKHEFHELCITKAIESNPRCPLCMSALGVQRGNQPSGGNMSHTILFPPLPGYPNDGTIRIHYSIPGGKQDKSHPNPGQLYPSTNRTAYLPNNIKGQKVLRLLEVAFERGLIFTVGTSRTLGLDNMVTWNDIHHKTTLHGAAHGYPDDGYLDRVIAELKDKGVE